MQDGVIDVRNDDMILRERGLCCSRSQICRSRHLRVRGRLKPLGTCGVVDKNRRIEARRRVHRRGRSLGRGKMLCGCIGRGAICNALSIVYLRRKLASLHLLGIAAEVLRVGRGEVRRIEHSATMLATIGRFHVLLVDLGGRLGQTGRSEEAGGWR